MSDQQLTTWLDVVSKKRSAEDRTKIASAIEVARAVHAKQVTVDGMDRLLALVQAADTLNYLKLDTDSILATLLSELPSQADFDPQKTEQQFGVAVTRMVQQVAKIRELAASGVQDQQQDIEKVRRLLLGIADDVRSILVVLAKRLRLMRYLKYVTPDLQQRIAFETSRVHAPLANRLGVWQLKWELEDLGLRFLEPEQYKTLASKLNSKRQQREAFITSVSERIQSFCDVQSISAEVSGRPKHIYSIWKKMQNKNLDFEQVYDVRAVRVLVDTVPQCYEVLGLVHAQWRPVSGEFDDYIAHPKPNGYSSLHTAVIGDDDKPLEIQVRTKSMHEYAERGIAAHWRYKESDQKDAELERRVEWMRSWLEQNDASPDSLLSVDNEFEARSIFVLSPQGKVVELPNGATPVDFAYIIHTDVGHRCRGAKVNGHIVPLSAELESGQQVEILTVKEGGPSRDWLSPHYGYVRTNRARSAIKHWLKLQDHDEHVHIGRTHLDREITRLNVPKPDLLKIAQRFNFKTADDLLAAIGQGVVSAIQVANTQLPTKVDADVEADKNIRERIQQRTPHKTQSAGAIMVDGIGDILTQMAKCCKPVPFDAIVGYITRGRGVTVHRKDCNVVVKMDPENKQRLIDVSWSKGQSESRFTVDVKIIAGDRKGLLRDISSVFANLEVDVLGVSTQSDRRHDQASMKFTLEVRDMHELSQVIDRLAQIPDIIDVRRQR